MNHKKKDLLLVCNKFPIGFGEVFLEVEFPYLYKAFQKIVILTITDEIKQTRNIPNDVLLVKKSRKLSLFERIKTIWYILLNLKSFINLLLHERKAFSLINKHINYKSTIGRLKIIIPVFDNIFRAFNLKRFIEKNALTKINEDAVLYSYWQDYTALSLALIKEEKSFYTSACRAHRADLYFDTNKYNYLPFRKYLSDILDKIVFISEDGLKYQSKLLNKQYNNFIISRLGTLKNNEILDKKISKKFIIVSCSTLTPVKRIHLIIDSLTKINEKNIHWIHFGEGILKDKLISQAKEKLDSRSKITYTFMGNVKNSEIHNFYANNKVNIFINISESEGIPVSIMEAISYGIPVIATDVGGTREIINDSCGLLLKKDIDSTELASKITKELNSQTLEYKAIKAKEKWGKYYDADKNFLSFINILYLEQIHIET